MGQGRQALGRCGSTGKGSPLGWAMSEVGGISPPSRESIPPTRPQSRTLPYRILRISSKPLAGCGCPVVPGSTLSLPSITPRQLFFNGTKPLRSQDPFPWSVLATTLETVATEGDQAFYTGRLGQMLVDDIVKEGQPHWRSSAWSQPEKGPALGKPQSCRWWVKSGPSSRLRPRDSYCQPPGHLWEGTAACYSRLDS